MSGFEWPELRSKSEATIDKEGSQDLSRRRRTWSHIAAAFVRRSAIGSRIARQWAKCGRMKVIPKYSLTTIAGLLALTSGAASAASFVKYTDRDAFSAVAGPIYTETFNSVTSDLSLDTAFKLGSVTLQNHRPYGPYGFATIDTPPNNIQGFDGSSLVVTNLANLGTTYQSFLSFEFDEAITSFGANFSSGAVGVVTLWVDGVMVDGQTDYTGGFFGFTTDVAFKKIELRSREGSITPVSFDNLTYSVAASVPEPASWAMMIGGLAIVGGAMRRRRTSVSFA